MVANAAEIIMSKAIITKGHLEKLLPLAIADSSGVNVNESERERSGIIRGQFYGVWRGGAIFRGALKLKLPTSRSPPNGPKPAGARARPHGAASGPPTAAIRRKVPFSSKIATAPMPGVAVVWAVRPGAHRSHTRSR